MSEIIIINCQITILEEGFFQRAEMCLSKPELKLFAHCKNTRRQQQFLAGHYLLRLGLSHLLGEDEGFWEVGQETGTAPVLLNAPDKQQVYLSISHSKDQVICAVSIDNEVGVDIENHQRERPFIEFSEQYLSDQELSKLKRLEGVERQSYFYALWTVMESVAKTQGKGLGQDIFDGSWNCEQDTISSTISNNHKSYSTYTTLINDFTVSIATKQPLSKHPFITHINGGELYKLDACFSRGSFCLN
jgi:4'-phosphopantetheinyl transferase